MFLVLLTACTPPEDEKGTEPVVQDEIGPMNVQASPESLVFGVLELGTPSTQVLTLSNLGDAPVTLTTAISDTDELVIEAPTGTQIAPGASADITVTWAPTIPASLDDTLEVLVAGSQLKQFQVPVSGTAAGPVIELSYGTSGTSVDFGTTTVGCSTDVPVTLTNAGTGDLVITSAALVGGSEITLVSADGAELPPLPWTIASNARLELALHFAPTNNRTITSELTIVSNDPVNSTVELNAFGEGFVEAENSIEYGAIRERNITLLYAANQVATTDARFEAALPTLFDALRATGAEYRVAFITATTGEVYGDVAYIDNSYTTEEAVPIAMEMVSTACCDNDYLLQTLQTAIDANREWLLDEDDRWLESKLSLVASNSDMEQSSGDFMSYLLQYWTYKEDPDNITVDAITGEAPRGCTSGSFYAEPAEALQNAAANTDGEFCSWCVADWGPYMEAIAENAIGDQEIFELTGEPAVWSIEVYVDGVLTPTGWTYDATRNAVVFDESEYPVVGAEVRVDYIYTVDCPV